MESALREGGRAPDLKLIETMLWDGATAPRWPLHLARLQESARALGWPVPAPAPPHAGNQPARLRLTLDGEGRLVWEEHPLPPPMPEWRVGLSSLTYRSSDPWLRLKSSRRALQDAARAALPEGLDEVLFCNEFGEVCEGTITTLFFDRGEGLRTPPLSSGLLAGVLRREMACPEEVLKREDLPHVRLWLGNALRGLIPARLIP